MPARCCPTCGQKLRSQKALAAAFPFEVELKRLRAIPPAIGSWRWLRDKTGHKTGCLICGHDLPKVLAKNLIGEPAVHANRQFCSNACRQRAYRLSRQAQEKAARASVTKSRRGTHP